MSEIAATTTQGRERAPLLSIGVPVYNDAQAIGPALEDLLRQSLLDLEIIISDNASTDGTSEICRSFAVRDIRVRYIRQVENIGSRANFQFVLLNARGKYFCWAASDDRHDIEFADTLVRKLEESENNVSAFCAFSNIDDDGHDLADFDFDFSAPRRSDQVRKFLFEMDGRKDVFIYGIHRLSVLRRARFYTWWGANAVTPFHFAYPVLAYLLAKGSYVHVHQKLFFSRMFPGRGNRYPVTYENRRILRLLARNGLELNVHWAIFHSIWQGSRSLSRPLTLTPAILWSLLLTLFRVNRDALRQFFLKLGTGRQTA
jgi:glycosyltransferase involved in cell wall biosynthesis